jgi:LPS-assembly protein
MRQARLSSLATVGQKLTRRTGRALLLTGAAIALVCLADSAPAFAQDKSPANRLKTPQAPLPDDGLGPRDLLLQADELAYDKPANTVTAIGHVQARYQGKTLRADRLEYNSVTGAAHAIGHAVIIDPDGTAQYGEDVTLDDQFRAAVAIGFAAHETGNVTMAAGSAVRRTETVNQLNNAIYTTCNVCAEDGSPKSPSWRIEASRIIEDRQHAVIYYRNAVVKVLGIPVFYSPVFWHPDYTVARRSGLLAPVMEISKRRGFSYEQGYLMTLGPSTDLVVSPQFSTRVNPLLNLRYTERFYSGMIDIRAGTTYEKNFSNDAFFDKDSERSYILGRGEFAVAPNWVWGFGAERVSDPTFFQRYAVHDVYTEDRGPFPADTDRLISQLYTVREDKDSYISVSTMDFQSLRVTGGGAAFNQSNYESSRTFPVVGPLVEIRYDPTEDVLGGELSVRGSAVALSRNQRVLSIFDPTGNVPAGVQDLNNTADYANLPGYIKSLPNADKLSALEFTDSRRATGEIDWRTSLVTPIGIKVEPFVYGRADAYSITDEQIYNQSTGAFSPGKDNIERVYGTVGATVSWPFIKPMGGSSIILEPMAQVAVSPVEPLNHYLPNEDSASFEYDETNLFSPNRFAGFDLVEGGQRLNVGGRATIDWGASQNATFVVGRTFRAQDDPQFNSLSGLAGTASDWIVSATANPLPGFSFFTRSRLDADDFSLHREEAGAGYFGGDLYGAVRYDYNQGGLFQLPGGQTTVGHTEDVSLSGQAFFTKHWGVSANVTRDLVQNVFPISQVGLIYRDECIRVDILYTHDETFSTVIGTSDSISFRITLATLGDNGPLTPTNSGRGSR